MLKAETAVLFDIDSTLRDSRQRHHLSPLRNPGATWHDYTVAGLDDEPIRGTIAALRLHWQHHQIHLISGSNASASSYTKEWLHRHVGLQYVDQLQLRPEDNFTENGLYKVSYARSVEETGVMVMLVYEDWPPAVRALQDAGFPTVCVNPCYPCLNCGLTTEEASRRSTADSKGGGL